MCQPELKPPSVEIRAIRSRTTFVSDTRVVVVAAIAMPAPIAPPTTNATRTAHFFERSLCIATPLPVDTAVLRGFEPFFKRTSSGSSGRARAKARELQSRPISTNHFFIRLLRSLALAGAFDLESQHGHVRGSACRAAVCLRFSLHGSLRYASRFGQPPKTPTYA